MSHDPEQVVQRIRFEAWADKLIAKVIEDLGKTPAFKVVAEEDDVTVHVRLQEGQISATIRAYIPSSGWNYHDRVVKMGEPNQQWLDALSENCSAYKTEVERLRKAGNAVVDETIALNLPSGSDRVHPLVIWWDAAKGGKQP